MTSFSFSVFLICLHRLFVFLMLSVMRFTSFLDHKGPESFDKLVELNVSIRLVCMFAYICVHLFFVASCTCIEVFYMDT